MAQPPNLLQGPEPVETADLHFKLICKLKIFEPIEKYEDGNCSLLAVSQHYGLAFTGNLNGFSVLKTKSINAGLDCSKYPKRDIMLNLKPSHLSVDNSQRVLAVVCKSKPGSLLATYNIASFLTKDVAPTRVTPLSKVIQNSAAEVFDLAWQPNSDGGLMLCMSDGSVLAMSQANKDGPVSTLPSTVQAMCFCWSPKGKQIVIGSATGTLSQYKPDLKLVKTLPAPPLFNGAVTVVSILWISCYQFAVAYNDRNNPETFPVITIVNAVKNEPMNVINYDDITYSTTLFRHHQIYMTHQNNWNLIFVSSANSIEVAVLHCKDNITWEQWLLGDASRAELPLNPDRQETFPLGFALDFTSEEVIPWGEGTLPPMPRLFLLSDEGILCIFNVVNATENAPSLCSPSKESIDDSLFQINKSASLTNIPVTIETSKMFMGQVPPAFGESKPTYTFGTVSQFGGFTPQQTNKSPLAVVSTQSVSEQESDKKVDSKDLVKNSLSTFRQDHQPQSQQQQSQPQPLNTFLPDESSATTNIKYPTGQLQFGSTPDTNFSLLLHNTTNTTKSGNSGGNLFKVTPFAGSNDLFSGKNLMQSTPIKQPEPATVVAFLEKAQVKPSPTTTTVNATAESKPKVIETTAKNKSPTGSPDPEMPKPIVDDSVYLNAVREEIDHFNSELEQLSEKMKNIDIEIGTDEEKTKIKNRIDNLYDFWKELKETTESQSSEIHGVVMDLMESFAWLEDAKSRNLQRKNSSYIELKKSEELDPLSAKHMAEIGHLKYYIVNQLKQLTTYLEKEWTEYQENYRMEVKNRMAVPPLEKVYKTMHYQLKILSKQKSLVEEFKEKIAAKKRKNKSQTSLIIKPEQKTTSHIDNRSSELSKLAENLLQLKVTSEDDLKFQNWDLMKSQLQLISERSKKLTSNKQAALRDFLIERDLVKIRPIKTTFESSSFIRSLPLQKSIVKDIKPETHSEGPKIKEKAILPKPQISSSQLKVETEEVPKGNKPEINEKLEIKKPETPKSVFVFGGGVPEEKPIIPLTVQSLPNKTEEKSPLASLSGIVSSIGKENEIKPKLPPPVISSFVFGSSTLPKPELGKENVIFGSPKLEQKAEEVKTTHAFIFGLPKPSESVFGKTDTLKFDAKPVFGLTTAAPTLTTVTKTKSAATKTVTTVAPFTSLTTVATTTSFNFSLTPSATPTTTLSNWMVFGKEQTPALGTKPISGNIFAATVTSTQSSTSFIFNTPPPVFGSGKSGFETSTTSVFSTPKPTTESATQSTGFTFLQQAENKSPAVSEPGPVVTIESTEETEEVEVVKVEETSKKSEADSTSKTTPKITPNLSFNAVLETPKTAVETTVASTFSASLNVQILPTPTNSATTATSIFTETTTTTSSETPTTSSAAVSQPATTAAPSSIFSFATSIPAVGGEIATPATTTSILGQTPTTSGIFAQVSSTKPTTTTTNVFGGDTSTTPTTCISGIFEGASKPVFGQAATTPSTSTGSIFGGPTSSTNTFGQSSTPTGFGQNPDAVAQTANIFGQLLSESNRPSGIFGNAATPTTNSNIFRSPKNIFGGGTAFGGTTSSVFPQTTSVFGQPTASSNVFGQTQAPTSTSVFGQNICTPFGGGNQNSFGDAGNFNSKPIFGQSLFGQSPTSSASVFGGTSTSSIFGGSPSSVGNVFQTPNTSTTFGSTSPGPFSAGQGSVAETGFGAGANTMQKPLGGFGSPPVFGGAPTITPAFGAAPTFSGSTSFGSLSTFGSRPFESSQGTFGQSTGHSTTFENLANQNTMGFGNLAQQSQSQGFGGFGSSFENKPAFGGNSFSSWRSN